MLHHQIRFGKDFKVLPGDRHSQAAQMTLPRGATEGGPDNRHRAADQWLFVTRGTGRAIVNGATIKLRPGTLVFIQRGEAHEIQNTGRTALDTINLYVPPAYRRDGQTLPRGRS